MSDEEEKEALMKELNIVWDPELGYGRKVWPRKENTEKEYTVECLSIDPKTGKLTSTEIVQESYEAKFTYTPSTGFLGSPRKEEEKKAD